MMDCSQFREALADLDRPGMLTSELREQALAHAEGCGDCGQLLTETESLDSELRRLAEREAGALAPARVEDYLLTAFRERKDAVAAQSRRRYAAVIGIAATVLLALGFWMYRRSAGNTQTRIVKDVGRQLAAPRKIEAGNAQLPHQQGAERFRSEVAVHRGETAEPPGRAASSAPSQLASEDASPFTRLPDADYPISLDDGAVVQVVMPRAALASFGLPVEAMEGDGTVRADLIVSADGTPQAIRLVSQDDADGAAQR
ncbi:MAG: hypothetical protein ACRD5K_11395 [Candidatus Acidiferrales bacterium]